jgi:tetratricopeptide (TPR) repeat protein
MSRRTIVMLTLLLFAASAGLSGRLAAQEPEKKDGAGYEIFKKAYALTTSAKTIEDFTKIIEMCNEGLALETKDSYIDYGKSLAGWAHNKRGEAYAALPAESAEERQKNEETALADFEKAVEFDSKKWRHYHNRSVSYALVGKYEEAMRDCAKVIELQPNFAKAYYNRGELYFQQGKLSEAIRDYTRAIELDPSAPNPYNSRGFAYYKQNNTRAALADYNRALQIDERHYEALINRGDVYADSARFSYAIRDYLAAVEAEPNQARAYLSAAWFRATCPEKQHQSAELALRSARKAIELGGESWRSLDVLAAALARAGQFKEAAQTQQRAIQLAADAGVDAETTKLQALRLSRYESGKAYVDLAPGVPQPD